MQTTQYRLGSIVHFTMPEMIEAAKKAVAKDCEDGDKRKWLGSILLCPYVNTVEGDGIELWALEGTPMRGIVIANYGTKEVIAFNAWDKRLKIKIRTKGSRKTISRV